MTYLSHNLSSLIFTAFVVIVQSDLIEDDVSMAKQPLKESAVAKVFLLNILCAMLKLDMFSATAICCCYCCFCCCLQINSSAAKRTYFKFLHLSPLDVRSSAEHFCMLLLQLGLSN